MSVRLMNAVAVISTLPDVCSVDNGGRWWMEKDSETCETRILIIVSANANAELSPSFRLQAFKTVL